MTAELESLRRENASLRDKLYRKPTQSAQGQVKDAVKARVAALIPKGMGSGWEHVCLSRINARALTDDLKWHLKVRHVVELSEAHIEAALVFIADWSQLKDPYGYFERLPTESAGTQGR